MYKTIREISNSIVNQIMSESHNNMNYRNNMLVPINNNHILSVKCDTYNNRKHYIVSITENVHEHIKFCSLQVKTESDSFVDLFKAINKIVCDFEDTIVA